MNSSQDMFDDSGDATVFPTEKGWLGVALEELKPIETCTYPAVRPATNHTVFFQTPIPDNGELVVYPAEVIDVWDANHVRMPHSSQSLYPVSEDCLKARWSIIKAALRKPIHSSEELESAINSYNSRSARQLSFDALHKLFSETFDEEHSEYFFENVMPGIVKLALDMETQFRCGLPLLKKGMNRSISMTQYQAGVLMANAFLCTFPRRHTTTQYSLLPSINFTRLFQCGTSENIQQKLKCFLNYFRRVIRKRPKGVVTYTRRHIRPNDLPIWSESSAKLTGIHVTSEGTIEDQGVGMMEVDFANKFIGGGILGQGSVQEEIKFLICPELVVSRLFTECLDDTEAVIITGCERFNCYEGYGQTFTWSGNYDDSSLTRDSYIRYNRIIVAIDANEYRKNSQDQFKLEAINRELNKAYTGFSFGSKGSIATGNWGCGAFNGDPRLKSLLQIMAASVCRKGIAYYTFGDDELKKDVHKMHEFLTKKDVTVGILWQLIRGYVQKKSNIRISGQELFKYIYSTLESSNESMEWNDDFEVSCAETKKNVKTNSSRNSDSSLKKYNEAAEEEGSKEDSQVIDNNSSSEMEPLAAESYSISTEEGKKRCLETDQERWSAYQQAMTKFTAPSSSTPTTPVSDTKPGRIKRKISDYFDKTGP